MITQNTGIRKIKIDAHSPAVGMVLYVTSRLFAGMEILLISSKLAVAAFINIVRFARLVNVLVMPSSIISGQANTVSTAWPDSSSFVEDAATVYWPGV